MRILILSWIMRGHNNRQQLGFLDGLKNHCNTYIHGREELFSYKDNLKARVEQLYSEIKPDLTICYAGMFLSEIEDLFENIPSPKLMIEVDFFNITNYKWYKNNRFELIMARNLEDLSITKLPTVWLPWSVNPKEFFDSEETRRNIIGFAGSSVHQFYSLRRKARDTLLSHNLLEDKKKSMITSEIDENGKWHDSGKYPKYLRSITGLLTSTELGSPFAKTFEAMSSSTVVLSSPIKNKEILFGTDKEYYVEYKKDCSDIVKKAKKILNEPEWSAEIARNGQSITLERHTTEKRVEELYNNVKNLLEGKPMVKKWETN